MTIQEINTYLGTDEYKELPELVSYVNRKLILLKLFQRMSPTKTKHTEAYPKYIEVKSILMKQYPEMYI